MPFAPRFSFRGIVAVITTSNDRQFAVAALMRQRFEVPPPANGLKVSGRSSVLISIRDDQFHTPSYAEAIGLTIRAHGVPARVGDADAS
jgi:hypothetical protein